MQMILPATLMAMALTACSNEGDGSSIRISGDNSDGTAPTVIANGATGAVSIDVPGLKADISLPKVRLDAGNFDLNGVQLYPGSTIGAVNVDTGGDGAVRVRFTSPAAADVVQGWFADRLTAVGYTLTRAGQDLQGTNPDGKPFRMTLSPAADGRSDGTIVIGG